MKIQNLILFFPLFAFLQVVAQKKPESVDSTFIPVQMFVNMPKLFEVNYSYNTPMEQTFVSRDGKSFNSSLNNSRVLSMDMHYPLLATSKGLRFMLNGKYCYFEMPGAEYKTEPGSVTFPAPENTSYTQLSVLASQQLRIHGHNLFLTGIVSTNGLQLWSLDQITGLLSVSCSFTNTPYRSFALGMFLLFPEGYYPYNIIPSIIYSRKFNNNFVLDISFPMHIQMHYWFNNDFNIKGGWKLLQYGYLRYNDVGYSVKDIDVFEPKYSLFGSSEIRLNGMLWLSAELGYQRKVSSKVTEHGSNINDYLFKSESCNSFYGSVGLFFRPSFKKVLSNNKSRKWKLERP